MLLGCPIRIPADHLVCAHPRSFSQLVASFIASESLGIPHAPFSAFLPVVSLPPARFFFKHALQPEGLTRTRYYFFSFPTCQRTLLKVKSDKVTRTLYSVLSFKM